MALHPNSIQAFQEAQAVLQLQEHAFVDAVLRAGPFRPVRLQVRDDRELLWDGEPVAWLVHAMDGNTRIPPDGPVGQRLIARWPQLHTGPDTDADHWWVPRHLAGVKIKHLRFRCCPICQTWFIGHLRTGFCSDDCRKQHRRRQNTATVKRIRQRRRDGLWRECSHCGSEFTPKRSTAQFCSTACRVAAHRASKASQGNPLSG